MQRETGWNARRKAGEGAAGCRGVSSFPTSPKRAGRYGSFARCSRTSKRGRRRKDGRSSSHGGWGRGAFRPRASPSSSSMPTNTSISRGTAATRTKNAPGAATNAISTAGRSSRKRLARERWRQIQCNHENICESGRPDAFLLGVFEQAKVESTELNGADMFIRLTC